MRSPTSSELQQICIRNKLHGYGLVSYYEPESSTYAQEHEDIQASLLSICAPDIWPKGSYRMACPRPILVNKHHQQLLTNLHRALDIAITDIVERWWTDKKAKLPERMPLHKKEEELLQWIEGQTLRGNLPHYSQHQGSWRPDFLIEENKTRRDGGVLETFQIAEINARFSFNGFMHDAYGQQALEDMGLGAHGLISATDVEKLLDRLFSLFDPNVPLYLLKGEEQGIDIHMFMDVVRRRLGVTPRLVNPSDLRLISDTQSKSGYRLCCLAKEHGDTRNPPKSPTFLLYGREVVEEINQIGLELHQHELLALQPEMLRQVSLRCFNDMRTILLVHDKRMLAIVKQELKSLVSREVLTPTQAHVLDEGIVDTILPGSQEANQLLQISRHSPKLKDGYIIKPVRSGKGAGIIFGEDLSPDEWVSTLARLQSPELVSETTCVVQHRIIPRLYDLVLNTSGERLRYPLVGTYHAIGGEFLGLGIWRSSSDRICAISRGGSWMCSVIPREAI
ncbi:hypothetical protein F4804DRAFT_346588 [Jackrogersella minutella]|nr:hypothetical protein F4804DRAFT_346588 [Jackrogersella minutella]